MCAFTALAENRQSAPPVKEKARNTNKNPASPDFPVAKSGIVC